MIASAQADAVAVVERQGVEGALPSGGFAGRGILLAPDSLELCELLLGRISGGGGLMWLAILDIEEKRAAERAKQAGKPAGERNSAPALDTTAGSDLTLVCSRPLGGTDVLDGLWRRLGIDAAMRRRLKGRRITTPVERILFGLVAGRALAPSSKLAAADQTWPSRSRPSSGLIPGDRSGSVGSVRRPRLWGRVVPG